MNSTYLLNISYSTILDDAFTGFSHPTIPKTASKLNSIMMPVVDLGAAYTISGVIIEL